MKLKLVSLAWAVAGIAGCGPAATRAPVTSAPPAPPKAAAQAPAAQAPAAQSPAPGKPVALPARFEDGRILVAPITQSGHEIVFYTDTGGGFFNLDPAVAKRLSLPVTTTEIEGHTVKLATLGALRPGAAIPLIASLDGRLVVAPEGRGQFVADGRLGASWFRDRTWTFDYLAKKLWWRAAGDIPPHDPAHEVTLGFQVRENGQRTSHFARIPIRVDGHVHDMLFDTGAMVNLSDSALAALADGRPATRATSFIIKSVFDRWHKDHPDWRVIEQADQNAKGEPMIEVPAIEVAGFSVGPVWFTRRADDNFHKWMSQWMDKPIDGALGGSALHYFRVTVDYPSAIAVFER